MTCQSHERPHAGYFALKRALDLLIATIALLISAPLLLATGIAIKLNSTGPIFYTHLRVGEGGDRFRCYKFRSMENDAAAKRDDLEHLDKVGGPAFKAETDPRVTKVGAFLRRSSIDELPQLVNVLRGEMSLVGPRPLATEDFDRRGSISSPRVLQLTERRLLVKPGITGLWQVSGRSLIPFEQWMELDDEYVRRRSTMLDLWILMRTIPAVISTRGAF